MAPYFLSLGGQYCNTAYTKAGGYINSAKSIAALQKLVNAYDQGLIGKCLLGGQPGIWDGLKANDGYMMADDGPWFFSLQNKSITSKYTEAKIPSGAGGSISLVGGEDLVMFQNSSHRSEAWEFMKYLAASPYPQQTMAVQADCIPTYMPVAKSSAIIKDPIIKAYIKQLKSTWARIPNQHYEEMDTDINKAFESAFRHQGTVKDILNNLAKQLDALFANKDSYSD
jgi:multiple sugar transport system substrate-binding protein